MLVELWELEPAIKALHQALALRPEDSGIMINLGWAHLRAGEFDQSLNWSYRALEADPHDPFPYRNIGHALLGMGRTQDAKAAHLQVIRNRLGDETFDNTFREFEQLKHRLPEYADIDDVVAWFRDRLDTEASD